ncbi:hypothetical protein ACFWC9_29315 [Streptomyces goshikiensis]|uniref:hypothetical protein n=1 Tax=Streptomyces goshikiensis TaxID=1942 RepID=UPI0036CD7F4B
MAVWLSFPWAYGPPWDNADHIGLRALLGCVREDGRGGVLVEGRRSVDQQLVSTRDGKRSAQLIGHSHQARVVLPGDGKSIFAVRRDGC